MTKILLILPILVGVATGQDLANLVILVGWRGGKFAGDFPQREILAILVFEYLPQLVEGCGNLAPLVRFLCARQQDYQD